MRRKKLNQNRDYYRISCDEVDFNADEKQIQAYQKVIDDLRDTLRASKNLLALSAPQIGKRYRIFCMKFANNDIRTFINPLVVSRKELVLVPEVQIGFESKDVFFMPRYNELIAGYQRPVGNVEQNKFTGVSSYVFDQMIQLLDGVFISDYGLPKLPEWDEASEEDKKAILEDYSEWLSERVKMFDEDLSKDETFKRLTRLSEYYKEVMLGNIEFAKDEPATEEKQVEDEK